MSNMELVDMDKFDEELSGLSVTRIVAKNKLKINLAGIKYDLEPGNEISIWTDRKHNKNLDTICRATSPQGKYPEEYIDLSKVDWYCSNGGILEIFYDGPNETCTFITLQA
jgi:hypothetical protein